MIRFESVSKTYPNGAEVIHDFSLEVPEHDCVALVGSSGSGKTTLLRMVNRMVDPTSGSVFIGENDVADKNPVQLRRDIGYVIQEGGLLPHKTLVENVAIRPRLFGESKADSRSIAEKYLARVGLDEDLFDRYPAQISGGQRQRVGVARALAGETSLLLMDEPFGALDPIVRRELQALVRTLQEDIGITTLFVTHDIDEALLLGDSVVVLREGGVIAQQGTPDELIAHPADDFVRDFIGLGKEQRSVSIENHDGVSIAVDGYGRPLGIVSI